MAADKKIEAGAAKVAEAVIAEEPAPTMWETVKGVFFVLGVACALTISFTILSAYERGFTAVTYASDGHVAASAAEPQREKQKLMMPQKSYLMPSANSRAVAA